MIWGTWLTKGLEFLFLGIGSWLDLRTRELPLKFFGIFGFLALGCNVVWNYQKIQSLLAGGAVGIFFLSLGWLTKEAIGYGDGLGILILGMFEGVKNVSLILFGAFLLGGIYGGYRMLTKKSKATDTLPFFPFLMLSYLGVWIL